MRRPGSAIRSWFAVLFPGLLSVSVLAAPSPGQRWVVAGSAAHDLPPMLSASGLACVRADTAEAALAAAAAGDAVLVLADGYPSNTVGLTPEFFASALRKPVRLYVEFPGFVPGV